MSPAAAFHSQLASIMEVLANTAVAEICELVDSGYSVLQLEISRSRKENEVLRRKLRLMELRTARTTALRAAATAGGGGGAMLFACGRSRAHVPAHPGNEPRRSGTPRGQAAALSRVSNQETLQRGDASLSSDTGQDATRGPPAGGEATELTATVIKVEDDDEESWSHTEQDKEFSLVIDGQTTETEAPPPPNKQEVVEESGDLTRSWVSEEVSSTSSSIQKNLNTSHRSESGAYNHLMYEPQLQHGSVSTQNPLSEDPSCSYVLNTGAGVSAASESGCSIFPFTVCEATQSAAEHQQPAGFQESQERAPLPEDEPPLPARKELPGRQNSFVRRDRWRHQDGVNAASGHTGGDGGGKFVCNYCSKTLACLKNLKTHMRVHTGEKPFVCALCGKRFSDSSNLKRHQSVHTGEKRYGCVHCGKRFAQSGSLKVHMTVHTDCKQFRCSHCGKTFISGSHLRRHVTVHAREKQLSQMPQ